MGLRTMDDLIAAVRAIIPTAEFDQRASGEVVILTGLVYEPGGTLRLPPAPDDDNDEREARR